MACEKYCHSAPPPSAFRYMVQKAISKSTGCYSYHYYVVLKCTDCEQEYGEIFRLQFFTQQHELELELVDEELLHKYPPSSVEALEDVLTA
jgi:hypothetical protein